jgi:hypothetical protein
MGHLENPLTPLKGGEHKRNIKIKGENQNKPYYTIGWSKGGKKAYRKGCVKPAAERAARLDMP